MVATASLERELGARSFRKLGAWIRGVDTDLFRPDEAAEFDLPRPIFMTVGRVAVEKNFEALIALGFEFVNGFHDTANAVATVIYTHSLPAEFAVMWLGFFNFIGVLLSSGAVAFGIVSLLPVELILQVGSSAGFAMVFALPVVAAAMSGGLPRLFVVRPPRPRAAASPAAARCVLRA
jgi:hypothetical protein